MNPHNDIIKITILDELKSFIPPMLPHERENLKHSIFTEGCKTPLIVWRRQDTKGNIEHILVDGHNRLSICEKYNISYRIEEKEFSDIGAVRQYMADFQNARRNLNTLQRAYMIGAHYESLKQNALDNLKKRDIQAGTDTGKTTANFIARQYATSESTVKRYYDLFQAMRTIEKQNENALMLCFQCFNAKETTFVEFVAQASLETINSINSIKDVKSLYEAVKEGKKAVSEAKPKKAQKQDANPKVQNELSANDQETLDFWKNKALENEKACLAYLEKWNESKEKNEALTKQNEFLENEAYLVLSNPENKVSFTEVRNELSTPPAGFSLFYEKMPNGLDAYLIECPTGLFKYIKQNHSLSLVEKAIRISDYKPQIYEGIKPIAPCTFDDLPEELRALLVVIPTPEKERANQLLQYWVVDSVNNLSAKNKLQKACLDFTEKYKNVAFNDFDFLLKSVKSEIDSLNKMYANCSPLKVNSSQNDVHSYIHISNNGSTLFEVAINSTKIKSVFA